MTSTFDLTAGPDAGRRLVLAAGRHVLGRARHCSAAVDDPAVEPHHALLDVSADGSVELVQLAGRTPVSVDGQPVGAGRIAASIEVGDSRIELVDTADLIDVTRCDDIRAVVAIGVAIQPVLERAARQPGLPVLFDVAVPGLVVGIVDTDPRLERARSVARSIAAQLARRAVSDVMPELVLAAPGDPSLDAATALLEISARWRGRWNPDVTMPESATRLHVAGCRRSV